MAKKPVRRKTAKKRVRRRETTAQKYKKVVADLAKAKEEIRAIREAAAQARLARRNFFKRNRKRIIQSFEDARDYWEDNDLEPGWDFVDDLPELHLLDIEDFISMMFDEGYTEHEAYDLYWGY